MKKRYYQMVTNDKYELPLDAPMKAKELAAKLGIQEATVRYYSTSAYFRKQARIKKERTKKNEYKIVPIDLDFTEDELYE